MTTCDGVREELHTYSPSDPVLSEILPRVWTTLTESVDGAALDELHLCLINPAVASSTLKASPYFTESCQALRDDSLIIVNEQFLLEIEAAVRSFAQSESLLGSPYLKSDPHLFGLIRQVAMDPVRYLERLRRRGLRPGVDEGAERDIRHELEMVTLFFLGHELGHLLAGHDVSSFSAFIDPRAPLEDRIDEAVVKLCRHVDEFAPTQFGLRGFERVAAADSDVRSVAAGYRTRDERRYERHDAFFESEKIADEWANRIVIGHLASLAAPVNAADAERSTYLLVRAVFAAALFSWYRDLAVFGRKLGLVDMNDARDLTLAMSMSREQYVHAASLFGERHRFTLLRAALALETILRARSSWFDLPPDTRSVRCAHDDIKIAVDPQARRDWWLSESLQRYFFLCICMDTAVKMAHVGCATGWMRRKDRTRGTPQMLVMNFEPIQAAVARLRSLR